MEAIFAEYGHTLAALAGAALIAMGLSPWVGALKNAAGFQPGQEPPADYASRVYRAHRAHLNSVEFLAVFAPVALAAILAGVDPFWANALASAIFVVRLLFVAVYAAGVGAPNMGPRTFSFAAGWFLCLIMAVLTIFTAMAG